MGGGEAVRITSDCYGMLENCWKEKKDSNMVPRKTHTHKKGIGTPDTRQSARIDLNVVCVVKIEIKLM